VASLFHDHRDLPEEVAGF
ncbi:hypothetical protein Tco_1320391, partial [Tanacetum coccineum]